MVVHVLLGLLLLLCAIQDLLTRTVYREPILLGALLFFLLNALHLGPVGPAESFLGALLCGALLAGVRWLGRLLTGYPDAFGKGDVLLGIALGAATGPVKGLFILVGAFILAGLWGLLLLLKGNGARATMPWAPFLFLAFLLLAG
ncbi:MAG: prepilin peptidase [Clostridiales bacterium]|nr:prepilin peptidase [Clostridiales bacterium]